MHRWIVRVLQRACLLQCCPWCGAVHSQDDCDVFQSVVDKFVADQSDGYWDCEGEES